MKLPNSYPLRWLPCLLLLIATANAQTSCPLPSVDEVRLEVTEEATPNNAGPAWECPDLLNPLITRAFEARVTGEAGSWVTLVPKVHIVGNSPAALAFLAEWDQFETPTPMPPSSFGSTWTGEHFSSDLTLGSVFVGGALVPYPTPNTAPAFSEQVRDWFVPILMPSAPTYSNQLIESRVWSAVPPVWNSSGGSGSLLSNIWMGTLEDIDGGQLTRLDTDLFIRQTILAQADNEQQASDILESPLYQDVIDDSSLRITVQAVSMKTIGTSITPGSNHTGIPGLTGLVEDPIVLPRVTLSNPVTLGLPIFAPVSGSNGLLGQVPATVNVGQRTFFIARNARPGMVVRVPYIDPANPGSGLTTLDVPCISRPTLRFPGRMMFVVPQGMQPGPVSVVLPTSSAQVGTVATVNP